MKTEIPTLDLNTVTAGLSELTRKLVKGAETLMEIDEIDVGTAPKDLVYEEDKLRLYHYRREGEASCNVPVLIVYALVNRQYMLDLQPDRSIVRNLLQHGIDLYIIDWGYPTKADMYLSMDDYINGYLDNCVDFIRKKTKSDKINIMGICQGGTFSAIYSALYPEKIKNLVTLVAPFDFSTNDGLLFCWSKHMNADAMAGAYRVIPGDILNAGFLMLMPFTLNIRKYVDMLHVLEDREKLLNFLRMEQWIFDSPGQAGECIRQFLRDCYQGNKLVKGELKVGDKVVNLKNITMPLLNIYASADHLVPPAATKPFNDLVGTSDKTLYEFKGGHIGVFVGSKSQKELAPAISDWLHKRQDKGESKQKPTAAEKAEARTPSAGSPMRMPETKPQQGKQGKGKELKKR
ncbi:MAG TPA: class III poly(R)-hydroxyalkanoic acid synthase subunit PhaC [Thermodesulfovibrionales bacterium]|nr:class III poly(R)-hydroxyalkanoic acid synthase subunit PhaC [Thermodesulfovibrionales bacterium]